ncbi:MAG: pantoate--beta-alanine ligase [Candidatus Cyclobacteriaceae bacterium M3_2C_046]
MVIFKKIEPLKAFLKQKFLASQKVGFVPTMGALHQGHLSLLEQSKQDNQVTVCSIYINPTQFNNPRDLRTYPRNYQKDQHLLENIGCDVLFLPEDQVMYPQKSFINFDLGPLDQVMEGSHRPGHFNGVALVVNKLLNIVQPDQAYFGQKDLQQFMIIQKMVDELFMPVKLMMMPVVRDQDSLALSSRNARLNAAGREVAPQLFQSLSLVRDQLEAGHSVHQARQAGIDLIKKFPRIKLEYLEVAGADDLMPVSVVREKIPLAVCIAAEIEGVRLIDNLILNG